MFSTFEKPFAAAVEGGPPQPEINFTTLPGTGSNPAGASTLLQFRKIKT